MPRMKRVVPFWRRRLVPVALGLLALNLVVYLAYTLPRSLGHQDAEARAQSLREDVARERLETAQRREYVATVTRNREDVKQFYASLVERREEGLLPTLREIEALARDKSLVAGSRAYQREEIKGASLTRVGITVPLKGTYTDLVGFLAQIESGKRFITVDRVALRRQGDTGEAAQLSVDLSAIFKEGGAAAGVNRGS
jgi:Tfp pilus assembly protein PilO